MGPLYGSAFLFCHQLADVTEFIFLERSQSSVLKTRNSSCVSSVSEHTHENISCHRTGWLVRKLANISQVRAFLIFLIGREHHVFVSGSRDR